MKRAISTLCLIAISLMPGAILSFAQAAQSFRLEMPKSRNPISSYSPTTVPEPQLANSPRLDQLIRDGKLYLSLKDTIDLALENNLDLAIARYNMPIADTDILRTRAGGLFRGVNTGVVQGTPGGGVGGLGAGAPGAGAGGTTGGAGGAGAGASGLVQSTLGTGTNVSPYDPSHKRQWRRRAPDHPAFEPATQWCADAANQHRTIQPQLLSGISYRNHVLLFV